MNKEKIWGFSLCKKKGRSKHTEGFTLFELLIVLFLITIIATIILPRITDIGEERVRDFSRRMIALSSFLTTESSLKRSPIRLYFDLDNGRYWATLLKMQGERYEEVPLKTSLARSGNLPEGITFLEVVVKNGSRRGNGITYTTFTPWGYRDKTYIYLKMGDNIMTIIFPSFGNNFRVYEGYVERESKS